MSIASIKRDLLDSLRDKEFRDALKLENVYTGVCFQIRAIREQQHLSQRKLGALAEMAQERISILEDPNAETKPTINTLLRVADALDVGLDVRFVPFSKVIDRSVHTDMRELEVPKFEDELESLQKRLDFDVKTDKAFLHASAESTSNDFGSAPAPKKRVSAQSLTDDDAVRTTNYSSNNQQFAAG